MTTRPSEPSSRRRSTAEPLRRELPALVADRELRPLRPPERRRAPTPVYVLAFGELLPSDYYLG